MSYGGSAIDHTGVANGITRAFHAPAATQITTPLHSTARRNGALERSRSTRFHTAASTGAITMNTSATSIANTSGDSSMSSEKVPSRIYGNGIPNTAEALPSDWSLQ